MRRVALLCMGLVMGAASAAEAQLTMQMSNGWSFTFGGNVNAFLVYEKESDGTVPTAPLADRRRRRQTAPPVSVPACCPAFAVFDAKGKEGNTDLGRALRVRPADPVRHRRGHGQRGRSGHDCFGAQIDMRQVYLTVGGTWGQILAGRELGLFGRQNILTDQTLFGVGATGGAAGRAAPPSAASALATSIRSSRPR